MWASVEGLLFFSDSTLHSFITHVAQESSTDIPNKGTIMLIVKCYGIIIIVVLL